MLLWHCFLDNKVMLSSGKTFGCKEPGWFRLVFSDKAPRLSVGEQPHFLTASFILSPSSGAARSSLSWFTPHPSTQPPVLMGLSLPLPRDAEGPAGS